MAADESTFQIQVFRSPSEEILSGYPKYANNEVRAHAIAEEAVQELQSGGDPGEYLIAVSLKDTTSLGTQVVIIPTKDVALSSPKSARGLEEV